MTTPEDFVLIHADRVYDPVKAHEYYMRTRQLKGRKPGAAESVASDRRTANFGGARKVKGNSPVKTPAQRQMEIEARVDALKVRLKKLREVLATLVEQAQRRSGIEPQKKTSATTGKDARSKDLSPAEKKKAAERSKEYREKNDPGLSDQEESLRKSIQRVEQQIAKAREELKSSIERARMTVSKPSAGPARPPKPTEGNNQNGTRSQQG
jgi:septal ring factor EnvC (AmiA/AmiB activator)